MSIVILAEKPSQGKDYADAFKNSSRKNGYIEVSDDRFLNGQKAFITWGFGQLKPETLLKLLIQAKEIIVATDPDCEGKKIAKNIIEQAGASNKTIKRLWFFSPEVHEIQRGFQNLKDGFEWN